MDLKPVPIDEQEMTINVFPSHVDNKAHIYVDIPHIMKRLKKLAEDHPDEVTLKESYYGVFCDVPVKWIKIAPGRKMSEEQRKAAAERMASIRNRKDDADDTV